MGELQDKICEWATETFGPQSQRLDGIFAHFKREVKELEDRIYALRKIKFRVGDQVYINDGERDPSKLFFLRESYNGGEYFYITEKIDDYGMKLVTKPAKKA